MKSILERAQKQGTPLIDGSSATFVWQGAGDVPQLVGDFSGWSRNPVRLSELEPGVWGCTLSLPRDAYVEYQFVLRYDISETLPDPFNPRLVYNGLDAVNHWFAMPDCQPPELIRRKPGVPRGAVSEHWLESDVFASDPQRKLSLYHPPVDEPTPLLVVWDGGDYLHRGWLNVIVDNLIAERRIRPLALALIESVQRSRFVEYMQSEATLGLLAQIVLPFAAQHLKLIDPADEPGVHGVLGSSMGGLMALYSGLRAPEVFGHVVCQSGAFLHDSPRHEMLIVDYVKTHPAAPLKIWQDVGTLEALLESNRQMRALLKGKGYDLTYREFSGGHNQTMWADNTWRGLEAVYPSAPG